MSISCDGSLHENLQIHAFDYPTVGGAPTEAGDDSDFLEEREENARAQGAREGELRAKREFEEILKRERAAIAEAVKNFREERERYYQQVETEVVQLALAIARKILYREAQVDPLLLCGVVQVALRKVEAGTTVKLKANPADVSGWSKALKAIETGAICELQEDITVPRYGCTIETTLGTAELGIESQLKEVENGFLDLLNKRPRATQ